MPAQDTITAQQSTVPGVQPEKVEALRRKYPVFRYAGFSVRRGAGELRVRCDFEIHPDFKFSPEVVLESANTEHLAPGALDAIAFNLGLIEMLSYWKAVSSPVIRVDAGSLEEDQVEFI